MAECVAREGVTDFFGLVGSGNFGLVDHMTRRCGVAYHAARHEHAAVAMADGYARVSGTLGVATVHQGPGLTNALTALTEATKARTPMLLLAGDTATAALYQNLDVDQDAIVASVGAGAERLRGADTAVADTRRALRRALAERRPIVMSIPIDIQELSWEPDDGRGDEPVAEEHVAVRPSGAAVARAAALLESTRRPAMSSVTAGCS